MDNCSSQFRELGSPMYALHIQEASEELSPALVLIDESLGCVENRTLITQNPLLELDLEILKIENSQGTESRKAGHLLGPRDTSVNIEFASEAGSTEAENFNETGVATVKVKDTEDSGAGTVAHSEETNSNCNETNGNTIESKTYHNKMGMQELEVSRSYLDLKEAAFAVHGLDLSLPIECDICNINFDDLTKFDSHMREHEETKRYMCQLCCKTYMSWQNLVAHRKVCHNSQFISCDSCSNRKIHYYLGPISYPVDDFPIGCEECNAGFITHNELNRHYRQHQTEKYPTEMMKNMWKEIKRNEEVTEPGNDSDNEDQEEKSEVFFKCNTCSEDISMETYLSHKKLHPNICVFYKCPYCKRAFYTYSRYISHKDAHGIKEYKCKKCPRVFKNKLYWDVHKLSHLISKKYKCFNCQLEFDAPHGLSYHIKEVHIPHPERKLTCDICTLHYPVERFMKHYLLCLTQLKSRQVSVKEEGKYTCSGCNEVFSNSKSLFRHKKVHSLIKDPHLCEVCGMSMQNLGPFIAHIRSHGKEYSRKSVELHDTLQEDVTNPKKRSTKIKSFICEFCGYSFKNNRLLKLHVQRHTGVKPFDCTICSMAFYTGEQLSVHMRHHTGERPYQCTVCQKSFASSGVLYAHRRLHYSSKQHVCPVCDKSFLWRSAYHNHMRSHSATRPFKCNECSKSFLFRHKLTAHKRAHTEGRLQVLHHQCADCGQHFTTATELQNHHENKCYLSMITFLPSSDVVNKEESLLFLGTNGDSATFSEGQ